MGTVPRSHLAVRQTLMLLVTAGLSEEEADAFLDRLIDHDNGDCRPAPYTTEDIANFTPPRPRTRPGDRHDPSRAGHGYLSVAYLTTDAMPSTSPPTSRAQASPQTPRGPLFRTIGRDKGRPLTRTPLPQPSAYLMIGRRAAAAGIATKLGNHSFRATGITAYLKNGGTLEKAAQMANHASTRTTQLYDRRREELSLDEVERIRV